MTKGLFLLFLCFVTQARAQERSQDELAREADSIARAFNDSVEPAAQTQQRSQGDLARQADSVRTAYRDSVETATRLGPAGRLTKAPRPPLEFRGHRLGDVRWFKKKCKKMGDSKTKTSCEDKNHEIGDIWAIISYVFERDRLRAVYLQYDADNYGKLVDAFSAKLGQPDTTWTSEWRNRMGATFANSHTAWERPDGRLILNHYASRITRGWGAILSHEEEEALGREKKDAIERAKKDL